MDTEALIWQNNYSVGLCMVDKQHKRFLSIINEIGDCIAKKSHKEKGSQLFYKLLHFVDDYLMKERMLANSFANVDYSYFREKHKQLLAKLRLFKDEYNEDGLNNFLVNLYHYLKELYPQYISYYTPSLINILKENGIK